MKYYRLSNGVTFIKDDEGEYYEYLPDQLRNYKKLITRNMAEVLMRKEGVVRIYGWEGVEKSLFPKEKIIKEYKIK